MRLATIFPESGNKPVAAVSVDAKHWVALHSFLRFFGAHELPENPNAPLEQFLPVLMPRFTELTRKVSDWPEHGRLFQKDGGKTLRARRFFPPILRPSTFRDFYAFEQHVRTARAKRDEEMNLDLGGRLIRPDASEIECSAARAVDGTPAWLFDGSTFHLHDGSFSLRVVDRPGVVATLVTLVDVPLISAATVKAVVDRYRTTHAPIVRPVRGAEHGHPVLIDRSLFQLVRSADPQRGIKPIVRAHVSAAGDVEVDDEGAFTDIDTPEDYARIIGDSP